jgi:hypothetical protein
MVATLVIEAAVALIAFVIVLGLVNAAKKIWESKQKEKNGV